MSRHHAYWAGLALLGLLGLLITYPTSIQAQAGRPQVEQYDSDRGRPGARRHGPEYNSRPYGPDYDMRRYGPEPDRRQSDSDLDRRLDERSQRERPAPSHIEPDDDRRSTIAPPD